MISTTRNIICLFFVFSLVPFVFSIKCWNCRSNSDPKCADPFDNTTIAIMDCKRDTVPPHLPGEWYSVCQKIRQKVNGNQVISRGCTWKRQNDFSSTCNGTSSVNNTIFCETCIDRDGCNGVSAVGQTIALLLAPLSLLLFK